MRTLPRSESIVIVDDDQRVQQLLGSYLSKEGYEVFEARSGVSVSTLNKDEKVEMEHAVDVLHRPLNENYAHAQIECAPHVVSDGAWKRLKEALCRIAEQRGWACRPASTCKDLHRVPYRSSQPDVCQCAGHTRQDGCKRRGS
jgi:CheY-like chemotaxis protein